MASATWSLPSGKEDPRQSCEIGEDGSASVVCE